MVGNSLNDSKCYKIRSISFPARGQQLTISEDLRKLKSWLACSPPQADTVCNGLDGLNQLNSSLRQLLTSPQALSNSQHEKWVMEMIEGLMIFIDICGKARDAICQMRECTTELQSALRRKRGNEVDIESNVEAYTVIRRSMRKDMERSLAEVKQLENKIGSSKSNETNNHILDLVRVLREMSLANASMFQKLLLFLSMPIVKPKASRWSLAKLVTKGTDSAQECIKNEFEDVDIEVMNLSAQSTAQASEVDHTVNSALEKLASLDMCMQAFENGLESLFKHLIYMRVTYLNICSQNNL